MRVPIRVQSCQWKKLTGWICGGLDFRAAVRGGGAIFQGFAGVGRPMWQEQDSRRERNCSQQWPNPSLDPSQHPTSGKSFPKSSQREDLFPAILRFFATCSPASLAQLGGPDLPSRAMAPSMVARTSDASPLASCRTPALQRMAPLCRGPPLW